MGRLAEVALSAELDAGHAGDRYQVVLHVEASPGLDAADTTDLPLDGALEVDDGAIRFPRKCRTGWRAMRAWW